MRPLLWFLKRQPEPTPPKSSPFPIMPSGVTITLSGEQGAGKTITARALEEYLKEQGFTVLMDTEFARRTKVRELKFREEARNYNFVIVDRQ